MALVNISYSSPASDSNSIILKMFESMTASLEQVFIWSFKMILLKHNSHLDIQILSGICKVTI